MRVMAGAKSRDSDQRSTGTNLCPEMSSLEAEALVISTDPLHVRFKINSMDHRTHLVNH